MLFIPASHEWSLAMKSVLIIWKWSIPEFGLLVADSATHSWEGTIQKLYHRLPRHAQAWQAATPMQLSATLSSYHLYQGYMWGTPIPYVRQTDSSWLILQGIHLPRSYSLSLHVGSMQKWAVHPAAYLLPSLHSAMSGMVQFATVQYGKYGKCTI